MEIQYLQEHSVCPNYMHGDKPDFHIFIIQINDIISSIKTQDTNIIFLMKGELLLSYGNYMNKKLQSGMFLLLPPGITLHYIIKKEVKILSCRFKSKQQLCENFRLDSLIPFCKDLTGNFHPLPISQLVNKYLLLMEDYITIGLKCSYLFENKQLELFHLLRAFYKKEELASFFLPILNKDIYFKDFILKNYLSLKSVSKLAESMNYSVSGFKKKFERCFGQSAFDWIRQQRAEMILKDLKENCLTNKEIASLYQFSSQARFFEFCKRMYGKTPGEIRQNK